MKKPIVVLEQWKKDGYQNRLVTDGYRIWLEYLPKFDYDEVWRTEFVLGDYWLKDFNAKKKNHK